MEAIARQESEATQESLYKDKQHQMLSEKRLFCCLSLEKGVKIIVYYDIFQFILQSIAVSISLSNSIKQSDKLGLYRPKHFIYWFFSSGLFTIILAIKCFYGFKFVWKSTEGFASRLFQKNIEKIKRL